MIDKLAYLPVKTFEEAIFELQKHSDYRALMGGTDLIVQMKKTNTEIRGLVDLTNIPNITQMREDTDYFYFGAGVTHCQMKEWASSHKEYAALGEASESIGTPQVRNIATIVGNICNAVPSCDMGAPALIFNMEMNIISPGGTRWEGVQNIFCSPKKNSLHHNELVKEFRIPKVKGRTVSDYKKFGPRKASDLAYVGVAALLNCDDTNKIKNIRIGLAAVAPTPITVNGLETLTGSKLDENTVNYCSELAAQCAKPITDFRATAEYRTQIVKVETKRALMSCLEKMGGCSI